MSIFKNFSENGQLINNIDLSVSGSNFPQYLQQNGEECVDGYLTALLDILSHIDPILNERSDSGDFYQNTPATVRRELEKYNNHQTYLLQTPLAEHIKKTDQKWPKGYLDATNDLSNELHHILEVPTEDGQSYINTGIDVPQKLITFIKEKSELAQLIQVGIKATPGMPSLFNNTNINLI